MDQNGIPKEIQKLLDLSKSSSPSNSIKFLRDAGTLCMERSSQATDEYVKISYQNRAIAIIDRAEKIKTLMELQLKHSSNGLQNMKSIQLALEEINAAPLSPLLKEPSDKRTLSNEEQIMVLKAGKIYDQTFKLWTRIPNSDDFSGSFAYTDTTPFFMPNSLLKHLDDWRKPDSALPPPQLVSGDCQRPTMKAEKPINLVQDAALDCSLVAGLCAVVGRTQRGFPSILNGVFYPYDTMNDVPIFSENGRYMFRFYFNGHYRLVEVDDRIPVSKSDRVLHVTDRNNPGLLWPALLEKAYFKLRAGGYDWDGSNSATDLWITTGWIPEHVVLQDPYPQEADVWNRLYEPFHNGDVLITIGTPAMSRELEEYHGLIGNHNYAILDLKEEDDEHVLLIKNPWCESPESLNPNHELSNSFGKSGSAIPKGAKVEPGNFWMPLSKVFRLFHVLYLNWNPTVFKSRKDLHFNWDLRQPRSRTLATSPQFLISSDKGGTVFLLLGRHLQDPVPEISKDKDPEKSETSGEALKDPSSTQNSSPKPTKPLRESLDGFLSMYILDRYGVRSYLTGGYLSNSPFLDGLQVCLSFKLEPKKSYTLAIKENLMPSINQNFTLSAFSHAPVTLSYAKPKYVYSTTIQSQWTEGKYGLASTSGAFNPQFRITVPSPTPIAAFLDCYDELAKVNLKLCKRGVRILDPKRIDILAENHSTEYELGGAWLETNGWEIGSREGERSHTLLVLNMDDDYRGKFALRLETNVSLKVEEIPSEYSGHLLRLPKAIFSGTAMRLAVPILPSPEGDLMKVLVRFDSNFIPGLPSASSTGGSIQTSLKGIPNNGNSGCQSLIKITLESGSGSTSSVISSSSTLDEEFRSVGKDGLRLAGLKVWRDITKEPWDLFLVIERSGGCTLPGSEERFIVDILTERLGSTKAEKWRGRDD